MSGVEVPDWIVLTALPGHVSWLLWIDNRVHATAWPYRLIKLIGMANKVAIVGGALTALVWCLAQLRGAPFAHDLARFGAEYLVACTAVSLFGTLPWLVRRLTFREADALLADDSRLVDLRPTLGDPPEIHHRQTQLAVRLPGNQYLSIAVHEKRLALPQLPAALEGLRVLHLTDIHLTGRLGEGFYRRIIDLAIEAEPDLIALTGDLIENERCWDWTADTFGRLQARYGAYFVLGNHDVRIDHRETRRRLEAAGLTSVGGAATTVDVRGVDVVIAGSERPWVDGLPDMAGLPPHGPRPQWRLFLSHSPDEYAVARRHDFDLMLAGHVHGGQIRIPPIGPILAPSRFGVRYASGVFHEPPTVLHVSRGASSKAPLRFFCPPELTTLILSRAG